jgi:eukaryotic-like serine/threonine-protein kinase
MLTPLPAVNADTEIMPGEVVADKYRFERLLGEGAQGWVWQAHNILLDAPVAIKVVRTESADKSLPDRLFREARAAARLGHPAIVRVFDLGQARNGAPFIVMELLEGETLADRLAANGRLSPELALRLFLPIADALLAAHAKGIVHRDVKPENIFLAISGETVQPKLLDFGIAKVTQEPRRARQITQTGAIVGSPAYLSPEQALGQDEIDERADVWSFCATLYECLTGELPFDGQTWRALRDDIIEGEPLSILDLGVEDAKLWQILLRGLSK